MGYGTLVGNKNPMTSVRSCEYPHFFWLHLQLFTWTPPLSVGQLAQKLGPIQTSNFESNQDFCFVFWGISSGTQAQAPFFFQLRIHGDVQWLQFEGPHCLLEVRRSTFQESGKLLDLDGRRPGHEAMRQWCFRGRNHTKNAIPWKISKAKRWKKAKIKNGNSGGKKWLWQQQKHRDFKGWWNCWQHRTTSVPSPFNRRAAAAVRSDWTLILKHCHSVEGGWAIKKIAWSIG